MKKYILHALVFIALTTPAVAQEMPAPRRMPREPVNRESLADRKAVVPASREVQGQVNVVDTERLRIGDFDMRLFGIVPPQLAASFGPQARAALDQLTAGQTVTCMVRDRDREGRFLATCRNAANADLALELLRRGLAVTARGSLGSSELGTSYIAAELAAEAQKTGLWSVVPPSAAVVPETPKAVVAPATAPAVALALPTPAPVPDSAKPKLVEEKPPEIAVKTEQKQSKPAEIIPVKTIPPETAKGRREDERTFVSVEPSFLARYQLLITGLVMLATALGMLAAIAIQRILDRRTEMKAIAAALRGELMAARSVCLGRLKTSAEIDDKDIPWPRIRSTLYQAYVGRIGWLGAELARRVASIYGQANDYASYYEGDDDTRTGSVPKRQALQIVINHIDGVLPRLASIEQTGSTSYSEVAFSKLVTGGESPVPQPMAPPAPPVEKRPNPAAAIIPPVVRAWTKVRDLAWPKKPAHSNDPIAEYTALIEEEMKRFAFDEGEDSHDPPGASITKLHG